MEPTYDEIIDLAARLGCWDCPKEWITYPTWVAPTRHGGPYLKIAVRYRDILLGKAASRSTPGTPSRNVASPSPGPGGKAGPGTATPRTPSTASRRANAQG